MPPHAQSGAPAAWLVGATGAQPGRPREFDNRYFLDDSVLPGPGVLRRHGLERVVYVVSDAADEPLADLEGYFAGLLLEGIAVFRVGLASADASLTPFSSPRKARPLARASFRRSAVGGFGTLVPEPSSGGSG